SVNITSGKSVMRGDEIVFYKGGKEIARYEVLKIDGHQVRVATTFEKARPTNEPFKIIAG
ncbi:MAG TPA: hypothetical protein VJK26_02065, partial [Patescibacteria group bacterium]|nr:hypothetical protein [Patescibacteria group bacterium]